MELLACQVRVAGTGGRGDEKKKREENCGVALLPGRTVDSWPEVTGGGGDHLPYSCENSQEVFFFFFP